jgi:hypothetical protein
MIFLGRVRFWGIESRYGSVPDRDRVDPVPLPGPQSARFSCRGKFSMGWVMMLLFFQISPVQNGRDIMGRNPG